MKMKSFAMLAISGLLGVSFAYIAPAMADDMSNDSQNPQLSANSMGSGMNQGSSNFMNDNNNSNSTNDNSGSNSTDNSGSSTDANSMDQGSPDTATGDDDY